MAKARCLPVKDANDILGLGTEKDIPPWYVCADKMSALSGSRAT